MAASFPKTFEIGRAYRNEGSSPEHAQEFTNMEFYWAFANYNDGMELVREMYIEIAKKVFGKTEFTSHGHTFDLDTVWEKIDYVTRIKEETGVDILEASEKEMRDTLERLGVKYDGENKERLTDSLWKYCRKKISGPAFLVNHPVLVAPLAKINPLNPKTTERFQPIIAGSELGNGYSELNDPIDQRERFDAQQKLIDAGDEEAMMPDQEFVEMLEYGMPPTCGFGFGERLFAFLVDKPLREIQLFPLMRPKKED
jgi:lysyl-tRNA synthetase class 2